MSKNVQYGSGFIIIIIFIARQTNSLQKKLIFLQM